MRRGTAAGLRHLTCRAAHCPPVIIAVVNTPGGNASRNTRRPDLIPGVDPFLTIDGTNLRYFNPAAFAIPAPGTYGNLPRNSAERSAVFHQFDLTLQKRFPHYAKRANVEFRTEIYNLFNRANFANPTAVLPNSLGAARLRNSPERRLATANVGQFGVINSHGRSHRRLGHKSPDSIRPAFEFLTKALS